MQNIKSSIFQNPISGIMHRRISYWVCVCVCVVWEYSLWFQWHLFGNKKKAEYVDILFDILIFMSRHANNFPSFISNFPSWSFYYSSFFLLCIFQILWKLIIWGVCVWVWVCKCENKFHFVMCPWLLLVMFFWNLHQYTLN